MSETRLAGQRQLTREKLDPFHQFWFHQFRLPHNA